MQTQIMANFISIVVVMTILTSPNILHAQCNPPGQEPTIFCQDAPYLCTSQSCFSTLDNDYFCCVGFCGSNTAIHNPQFFTFVPTVDSIEIRIRVTACAQGNALQSAIIPTCPDWVNGDIIACNPGTGIGGTMVLIAKNIIPHQPYWLLIDGSSGAVCEYEIMMITEFTVPSAQDEIESGETLPSAVCPGYDSLFISVSPAVEGATGYMWDIAWLDEPVMTTTHAFFIEVPADLDAGQYDICVTPYNACDTASVPFCFQMEVIPVPVFDRDTLTVCPEEFPIVWGSVTINEAGTYTSSFEEPDGCRIDSVWTVLSFPASDTVVINIQHCGTSYQYEGQDYFLSGTYPLHYPGLNESGCDSIALLHLSLEWTGIFIQHICVDSQQVLLAGLTHADLVPPSTVFNWYECDFENLLSSSPEYRPDSAGCYCLVAISDLCADTVCTTIFTDPCAEPCTLTTTHGCTDEEVTLSFGEIFPEEATFHWLIDLPGAPETYYTGLEMVSLSYAEPGCYGVSLTVIDGGLSYTCRDTLCISGRTSVATLCCSETLCGDCTTLIIELSGLAPWTITISSSVSNETIVGITDSIYFHVVCPPPATEVVYRIEVQDGAGICPATIEGPDTVAIVIHPLLEPEITEVANSMCVSANGDSLSFAWYTCANPAVLATSACFGPPESGCYCVDVVDIYGCSGTACYDFVISSAGNMPHAIPAIYPVPSDGHWEVQLPHTYDLPVEWTLVDVRGCQMESGSLHQMQDKIRLTSRPSSGMYFIKFISADVQFSIVKVILE